MTIDCGSGQLTAGKRPGLFRDACGDERRESAVHQGARRLSVSDVSAVTGPCCSALLKSAE